MRRLFVILSLLALGCAHQPAEVEVTREKSLYARTLYAPLWSGQEALMQRLGQIPAASAVFSLSERGARLITAISFERYWDEDKAVFVLIEGEGWHYHDPRTLALEPLAGEGAGGASDLVITAPGELRLFRAASVGALGLAAAGDVEIFRYDFSLRSNSVEFTGLARLTASPGADFSPIPLHAQRSVLYLHREETAHHLYVSSDSGGAGRPLLKQSPDILYPRLHPDGSLVFAANPDGLYKLYRIPDIAGRIESLPTSAGVLAMEDTEAGLLPVTEGVELSQEPARHFIASIGSEGRISPVLMHLPEDLYLEDVLALVIRHNPQINEQRALLAAALAETREPALYNWPMLNLGVDAESALSGLVGLPSIATGDTLSRQLLRTFAGLMLPVLDYRRNAALTEAAHWRAGMMAHNARYETNERVAEACALYFELQFLQELADSEKGLEAIGERRLRILRSLRELGESIPLQALAVENNLKGVQSERAFHEARSRFLLSRLKEVCGLPAQAEMAVAFRTYRLEEANLPPLENLKQIALLNHPTLEVTRQALGEAQYLKAAGHALNPRGTITTGYEIARRAFDRVETRSAGGTAREVMVGDTRSDETMTAAFAVQVPLAFQRARELHEETWDARIDQLRLAEEAEALRIQTALEEAVLDFQAAQRDFGAKQATVRYQLEKLRVARVQMDSGLPELALPAESPEVGPFSAYAAREEYLRAVANVQRTRMDLGIRYARVWRELGVAEQLVTTSAAPLPPMAAAPTQSLWMWRTKEVLETDAAMRSAIELFTQLRSTRIYAYLYSDALLLDDERYRHRLLLFLNLCEAAGVEVWGLLGEPEWLEMQEGEAALHRAMARITAFNAEQEAPEPGIRGVKLDLEPHSLAGWQEATGQARLKEAYLRLVSKARSELSVRLPLWVDIPVQFLREEHSALLHAVQQQVDGFTLMCYFNEENAIQKWAVAAVQRLSDPVEIGHEFSEKAAPEDSLALWPSERFYAARERLEQELGAYRNFSGFAYHDYEAVSHYFGEPRE